MPTYAYTGFDSTPGVTPVDVTEDNMLPLLVVWMFFTTNPDYLLLHSPEGYRGFSYQQLADSVGLSVGCVQNLFTLAVKNFATMQATANIFQSVTKIADYEGPGTCGNFSTFLQFASAAKDVWTE